MANNITRASLTILLWNSNGLCLHRNELEALLHDKLVDVALITETHLTPRVRFSIQGYSVYRTDHPSGRSHGGTAIMVRTGIQHHQGPPLPSCEWLQSTSITTYIQTRNSTNSINIGAVYCPPRFAITANQFEQFFNSYGRSFIVGGDFNSKHPLWGSRLITPRGRTLCRVIVKNRYNIHSTGTPTYWPSAQNRIPDLIDFFVSKGLSPLHCDIIPLDDLSSDHSPVLLSLDAHPLLRQRPPSIASADTDWPKFREFIIQNLQPDLPLEDASDIETAVEHITTVIQQSGWNSTIRKPSSQKIGPIYPQCIRDLIREKRGARRVWQQSRMPNDKAVFVRLQNRLRNMMWKYKRDCFETRLSLISPASNDLWKETRRLLSFVEPKVPLRKMDGSWAKTDAEKATLFAQHFSTVFVPHQDVKDDNFIEIVNEFLDSPLQLSPCPPPFTLADIRTEVASLPKKKTPGSDLITNEVVKEIPEVGLLFLTRIFNRILTTAHFPIQWKLSRVILVPKPGKPPNNVTSYRPISLLTTFSKLVEQLLLKRLQSYWGTTPAIPLHQFGFRRSHSTIHQIHRIVDTAAAGFERKEYTSAVFLDISSAFDRVWHRGLLYKLKSIIPDTYYRILCSFLTDRYFFVSCGSEVSSLQLVRAGVPQGAVLSPTLYCVYTGDFPTTPKTMTATYADDTVILTREKDPIYASLNLQHHLTLISAWLKKWRMKVSAEKSAHVTFTLCRKSSPTIFLDGLALPKRDKVRYLGLIIDKRLTWREHIKTKRQSLNSRAKSLFSITRHNSGLSLKSKIKIYVHLLRPVWLYGLEIFGTAKNSNLKIIQAFQSRFLRTITGAPAYVTNETLHKDLQIPYVNDMAKEQYQRFWQKLRDHSNPLIRRLGSIHLPDVRVRRLRRMWGRDHLQ